RYRREGLPPFRALVLDYPKDAKTWTVEDQYMIGESLMAAPVVAGQSRRSIYLPEGEWVDFWTHERHAGKQQITVDVPLDRIPLYVKGDAILPLAKAAPHTADPANYEITVYAYSSKVATATLWDDDGEIPQPLAWGGNGGSSNAGPYKVVGWEIVPRQHSAPSAQTMNVKAKAFSVEYNVSSRVEFHDTGERRESVYRKVRCRDQRNADRV
ncbi:MAG TPA: hypothetical protein VFE08_13260, partial [Candidatus Sulfotelmatobacter sp.]|nr:hypothetical protein [Candidatus Sulfotelmatobacter sp.]